MYSRATSFRGSGLTPRTILAPPMGCASLVRGRGAISRNCSQLTKLHCQCEHGCGDPEAWAQSQINIGATYDGQIRGDWANNQDRALAAYEAALTVYKREALPLFWAATPSNVALSLSEPPGR